MTEGERLNPFPGLRPFDSEEAHLFFGREGQSDELLRRLRENRFLAVVGTSGSGKSSLVRAGLLPSLYGGFMRGAGSGWRVAIFRPGDNPIRHLAEALSAPDMLYEGDDPQRATLIEAVLRRGALGFVQAVAEARLPADANVFVVVDQFEELFRFQRTAAERNRFREDASAFVKLLLEATEQHDVPIYVAITMRSDYLGDCAQFRDLPEAINRGQYLIPRMTRDEQRLAITGPVAVGGAEIQARLVNRLLNDVGDNPDELPILQHALMRTWDNWVERGAPSEPLDFCHYEAIGEMSEALSRHADEAYAELPDERSRQIAEKMFRRLTERGPDNREIRRPTSVKELCEVTGASEAELLAVIDVFRRPGRSFLMPPSSVPLEGDSLVDISHESLIRGWARLRGWVDEEADSARMYRRLAETASLCNVGKAGLWRDPDLSLALDWWNRDKPNEAWAAAYDLHFADARSFLERSRVARDAEVAERERLRSQQLRRTRAFVAVLLVLLAGASALAFVARRTAARAYAAEQGVRLGAVREAAADLQNSASQASFTNDLVSATVSPRYLASNARSLGYLDKNDSAVIEYGKALFTEPDFLDARVSRCDQYLNLGKPDSSVLDCQHALKQWPHSPLIYLNLGVGYGMLRRYAEAETAFDSAISSTKYDIFSGVQSLTSPSIQRLTGRLSLTLKGHEARTAFYYARAALFGYQGNRDFPKALAAADREPPSLDAILNTLDWVWLSYRSLPDSVIPPDYGAFAVEGALWERAGEIPGALDEARQRYRAFQRAHAKKQDKRYDDLAAWVNRRLVLHLLIPGTSRVAVHVPGDALHRTMLELEADKFSAAGQLDSALVRVNKLLAKDPNSIEYLHDRANIWYSKQAYDSLLRDAERMLAVDSFLVDAYFYRAFARYRTDQTANRAAILADLDRTLAYYPSDFTPLVISYYMLADSDAAKAIDRLERASRVVPGLHWVYYQMAVTQNRLHRYADARRSSEAALMLKRDTTVYYDELARAELGLNQLPRTTVMRRLALGYLQTVQLTVAQADTERAIFALVSTQYTLRGNSIDPSVVAELQRDVKAELASLGPDAEHYASAWTLIQSKQYERALKVLDSAIAIRPYYASYYAARSTIDSVLGHHADLVRDMTKRGDLQLKRGDGSGAFFSYLTAARELSGPQLQTVDPGGTATDLTALVRKMTSATEAFFHSREKAITYLQTSSADAKWPFGWSDPQRAKFREVMKQEIARLSSTKSD